jgi:hypothetical protein
MLGGMTTAAPPPPLADLYAADDVAWMDRMAALARAGRAAELDLPHLAEELELMASKERREVKSRLEVLLCHRLKWDHQPAKRSRSWLQTIDRESRTLADTFADSRTLRNHAEDVLADAYSRGIRDAAYETGLPRTAFPAACPYTLADLTAEFDPPAEDLPA